MARYRNKIGFLLILGIGVLWYAWQNAENQLVVVNKSGQMIATMKFLIGDKDPIVFMNVLDGKEVDAVFQAKSKDRVLFEGDLADGRHLRGTFIYLSKSTFGERLQFVVKPNGIIEFDQK